MNKKINVFWCGKPTLMKGYDYLEKIINFSQDINWLINIGNSISEVKWTDKTNQKVTFFHNLKKEDQIELIKSSDVFLSTSRVEGFGIALAEALYLGLECIVSKDCRVFKEFKNFNNLTYVDIKSPKKVIEAIKLRCKENSAKIRRKSFPFTQTLLIKKSLDIYKTLI